MKDPAVLLYTGDFLNGCSGLTMEERGQYITLLCIQHQIGHLSEKTIRLSVGSVSVDVLNKFSIDEEGLYYHKRMDEEIEKRVKYLDSRKVNGSKGGRPKKPYGKPKQNHSEDDNIIEDCIGFNKGGVGEKVEIITILSFDEFWDLYDKKVGDKTKLRKKYDSIKETDRELIKNHIPLYRMSQPDKQYRKDPQTYLNNKSWNDEIIIKNGENRGYYKEGTTLHQLAEIVQSKFNS